VSAGALFLVERLSAHGWWVRQPGQMVQCPSTETVYRHDRRGGPRPAGPGPRWRHDEPPPDSERRKLVWPPGQERLTQRHCAENWGLLTDGYSFVRPVPVARHPAPARYAHTKVPDSIHRLVRICQECGIMSELLSVSAREGPEPVVGIARFSVGGLGAV
jgi:hypothetical protein